MVATDLNGDQQLTGRTLLASDARIAYLLLNDARRRRVARFFGVSLDDSFLVSIIAAGMVARAVHGKVMRALRAPGAPAAGDVVMGTAALRESAHAIAGQGYPDSPMLGALVVTALAGAAVGTALKASTRGVEAFSRRARLDFDDRYGHVLRPDRLRKR